MLWYNALDAETTPASPFLPAQLETCDCGRHDKYTRTMDGVPARTFFALQAKLHGVARKRSVMVMPAG